MKRVGSGGAGKALDRLRLSELGVHRLIVFWLVAPSGCEMFVGDFVQQAEPSTNTLRCDPEPLCRKDEVVTCQIVNGAIKYVPKERCGAPELCNRERAECMACAPNSFHCAGELLQVCDPLGTGWMDVEDCAARDSRCDEGTGKCELCRATDSKCEIVEDKPSLLYCQANSDGVRVWNATTCAYACVESDSGGAYCQTCSTAGEKGCVESSEGSPSNTVRECSADLRWVTTPCAQGVCVDGECVVQ